MNRDILFFFRVLCPYCQSHNQIGVDIIEIEPDNMGIDEPYYSVEECCVCNEFFDFSVCFEVETEEIKGEEE